MADGGGDAGPRRELVDVLHMRGFRPLLLVLLGGIGAAIGFFQPQTTTYTSEHILFAGQLAADNLTPGQIDDFGDELRLAAGLPTVTQTVETQLGASEGIDYDVTIAGTASDSAIRITAEARSPELARAASRATALETSAFVLGQDIGRFEAVVVALNSELTDLRASQDALTAQAAGIEPPIALLRASELLFDTRQAAAAGDLTAAAQVGELEAEVETLRPLSQQYTLLEQQVIELSADLGRAAADLGSANTALANADSPLVLAEVATEEKSLIPARAQTMLLFAGLNLLIALPLFVLFDRWGRPTTKEPSEEQSPPVAAANAEPTTEDFGYAVAYVAPQAPPVAEPRGMTTEEPSTDGMAEMAIVDGTDELVDEFDDEAEDHAEPDVAEPDVAEYEEDEADEYEDDAELYDDEDLDDADEYDEADEYEDDAEATAEEVPDDDEYDDGEDNEDSEDGGAEAAADVDPFDEFDDDDEPVSIDLVAEADRLGGVDEEPGRARSTSNGAPPERVALPPRSRPPAQRGRRP